MARRLQDRVSDLPNEERRQSKTHRFGEIRKRDAIAIDKHAGTQQVKQLIDQVTVRRKMIVMLSPHYLSVERLKRFWNLHDAPQHLFDEIRLHSPFPPWLVPVHSPTIHRVSWNVPHEPTSPSIPRNVLL